MSKNTELIIDNITENLKKYDKILITLIGFSLSLMIALLKTSSVAHYLQSYWAMASSLYLLVFGMGLVLCSFLTAVASASAKLKGREKISLIFQNVTLTINIVSGVSYIVALALFVHFINSNITS